MGDIYIGDWKVGQKESDPRHRGTRTQCICTLCEASRWIRTSDLDDIGVCDCRRNLPRKHATEIKDEIVSYVRKHPEGSSIRDLSVAFKDYNVNDIIAVLMRYDKVFYNRPAPHRHTKWFIKGIGLTEAQQ